VPLSPSIGKWNEPGPGGHEKGARGLGLTGLPGEMTVIDTRA
jgi:hypothetical protein